MLEKIPVSIDRIPASLIAEEQGMTYAEYQEDQFRRMFELDSNKTIKTLNELILNLKEQIMLYQIMIDTYEDENKALKEEANIIEKQLLEGKFIITDTEAIKSLRNFIGKFKDES